MVNHDGIRFTGVQREKMRTDAVGLYVDGASLKEAAEVIGCSTASIVNFLHESGTPLRPARGRRVTLPDGMLTTAEAAALIGVGRQTLNVMYSRGDCPPRAEAPMGAHSYYGHYWRSDVEKWLADRAERRLKRVRDRKSAETARAQSLSANVIPEHAPDWETLIAACDAKREAAQLTWADVSSLAGVDAGQISRIRSGSCPERAPGSFFRLALWVLGSIPSELRPFMRPTEAA